MKKTRIPLIVVGAITALFAAGLLATGGAVLWVDGKKDDQGYISTTSKPFGANSAALATENLDVDLDGARWLINSDHYGKVRVKVTPRTDKAVFVGIARTRDVSAYLRGVSHTTLTDVDYDPFRASYRDEAGARRPAARPAGRHIWAASAHGAGSQTLTWDVKDGNWSVVVMNEDGSPGVHADVKAGAKVAYLDAIGWSAIGGGLLLLAGAVSLFVLGVRPPRGGAPATVAPATPVPVTAGD